MVTNVFGCSSSTSRTQAWIGRADLTVGDVEHLERQPRIPFLPCLSERRRPPCRRPARGRSGARRRAGRGIAKALVGGVVRPGDQDDRHVAPALHRPSEIVGMGHGLERLISGVVRDVGDDDVRLGHEGGLIRWMCSVCSRCRHPVFRTASGMMTFTSAYSSELARISRARCPDLGRDAPVAETEFEDLSEVPQPSRMKSMLVPVGAKCTRRTSSGRTRRA